ncbi:MAG: sulfite reductase subunit beta (hemoprotein), partial [Bacteroidetes bacterium]|nr:sulfite reductase subunit beta (hemoprotein) [Bacteroidota bacterium]
MSTYTLPPTLEADIDELEHSIRDFQDGKLSAIQLKVHRLGFGIYEQREANTFMVRIRCGGGIITPEQLEEVSIISEQYADNIIHLTTREQIQIHYVKLENIVTIARALSSVGLTSRGGGGNTVRNIIADEYAGIAADEAFDVLPYAIALTSRLIAEKDSWNLPRKFKIAFSGSAADRGYATLADLGFLATILGDKKGFRVYVAGGMGAKSQVANKLFDFIPDGEVYNVAKAVKNLFWKYGNRKSKHQSRMRFLWQSLEADEFLKRFFEEYKLVKQDSHPPLAVENYSVTSDARPEPLSEAYDDNGYVLWKKRYVSLQRQIGLFSILLPVPIGLLKADKSKRLAQFLKPYGKYVLRMTKEQNFLVRNLPERGVKELYRLLRDIWSSANRPRILGQMISCAGAATCQLGLCLSRGVAGAIIDTLEKSAVDLDLFQKVRINISGCPNSCGQHMAADIGFFGRNGRKKERLYPSYTVVAGAVIHDNETHLAEQVGTLGARDVPSFLVDFLREASKDFQVYSSFGEYYRDKGKHIMLKLCEKYAEVPDFDKDKNYYYDWGSDQIYSIADRGMGECSAGIFDLMSMDFANTADALKEYAQATQSEEKSILLSKAVFYVARTLLITRGVEPKSAEDVYEAFIVNFIDTGLVDASLKTIVELSRNQKHEVLPEHEAEIFALAKRVQWLYDNMDNAFNFNCPGGEFNKPSQQDKTDHATERRS